MPKEMNKLEKLNVLTEEASGHYDKFIKSDNLKAAVRCRRSLSELIKIAKLQRAEILDIQKQINLMRHLKSGA